MHLHAYGTVAEARAGLCRHRNFYDGRRPRANLDARTPDQTYFTRPRCLEPPENFIAEVCGSLKSGYALLAQRPEIGILQTNPAKRLLIENETVITGI